MKKKVISCILLFCMLVTLFVLLFCVDKKTVQYQSYNQENYISVMVYDETEDDYVKQNSIPTGDYYLNEELSYCEGRGSIEDYDSELGVVTTKIKGSDKCYYYFDIGMYAYITRDFSFNDYEQTLTIPKTGDVTIEVWGAQGGNYDSTYQGGYGAYAVGTINLTAGTTLYLNTGGQGQRCSSGQCAGGYNGGGTAITGSQTGSSGGGATSVALASGTLAALAAQNKQNQVIIIAAGGGGTGYGQSNSPYPGYGGNGGGIQGNNGTSSYSNYNGTYGGTGATQSGGGTQQSSGYCGSSGLTYTGSYGQGGASADSTCGGSGGGGGYYGGGGALRGHNGGGGGSSYIGYNTLTNKKMVCYSCTQSSASNTNTYTVSNTCAQGEATADCSKIGNGHIRITYIAKTFVYQTGVTNQEHIYNVPKTGLYKLEVWGASGGDATSTYIGGYGAYATGNITLTKGTKLYINVGEGGTSCKTSASCSATYNGGGDGKAYSNNDSYAASGGGATSIALLTGELKNLSSHTNDNQIIIVASGGGGGHYTNSENYGAGGHGGGIEGSRATLLGPHSSGSQQYRYAAPGTQNTYGCANGGTPCGAFGKGGNASDYTGGASQGSGGGAGWYGGSGANIGAGAGGSSYIANSNLSSKKMVCYTGCTTDTNISTYTVANNCVENDATANCSKTGNGYAKITLLTPSDNTNNITNYLSTHNPNGYRGSSHTDSATQNLYRYTGSYQSSDSGYAGNVDNYICLGSDASICPADNMYRIIGVVASDDNTTGLSAGMVKVMKNTSIGLYSWDGGTSQSDANRNVNTSNYRSSWTCSSTNTNVSSGCFPTWSQSYLNTGILNTTFYNGLTFKDKIANVKWHCYAGDTDPTASSEYSSSLCSSTASKISIMYVGDYLNAYNNGTNISSSSNSPWIATCTDTTNSGSGTEYKYPCAQWTMATWGFCYNCSIRNGSPVDWISWLAYNGLNKDVSFGNEWNVIIAVYTSVRPVFYLNNNVTITSGTGTYASPFRVS